MYNLGQHHDPSSRTDVSSTLIYHAQPHHSGFVLVSAASQISNPAQASYRHPHSHSHAQAHAHGSEYQSQSSAQYYPKRPTHPLASSFTNNQPYEDIAPPTFTSSVTISTPIPVEDPFIPVQPIAAVPNHGKSFKSRFGFDPQTFYPTPPSSPDLDFEELRVPPLGDPSTPPLFTPPLVEDSVHSAGSTPETLVTPTFIASPTIPIPLLLNTTHALPHAAAFRLAEAPGILSILGGNRVLQLDTPSLWDRMPYSAGSTKGINFTVDQGEEESVEEMVGGVLPSDAVPEPSWKKRHEPTSAIFVHPPTPERDDAAEASTTSNLRISEILESHSRSSSPATSPQASPTGSPRVRPSGSAVPIPLPLHGLAEVRSPPRRNLEMVADSLKVAQRRGRRPRLFGFTELPESSSSSANSSRANSREPSPERNGGLHNHHVHVPASALMHASSSAPGSSMLPRRQPTKLRNDVPLGHTIHSATHHQSSSQGASASDSSTHPSGSQSASTSPSHTAPQPIHHHHHQQQHTSGRRRENGLKLDFAGIIPITSPAEVSSAIVPSPYSAQLIRKKSGEILKPALKYGGKLAPNGTPLATPEPLDVTDAPRTRFESKSAPTTPSFPKYVHFDAQLERVKLFLHDQKPQVVSRNGSPTAEYTTSEGEEYPFPSTDEEGGDQRNRKVLQIKLPNFPTSHPPDTDLFLESLFLDDDRKSLRGLIQVKNLAFQKWVAVRFTFDWWQTTSEVTALHKDSVKGGMYDRFAFTVKLQDLLSKIEEKTLFLAIRYHTDGREIWDSNGGQNYQVLFEKVSPVQPGLTAKRGRVAIQPGMGKAIGGRTSQWSVTSGHDDDRLADLRAKLHRLKADDMSISPPQLSPVSSRHTSFSPNRRPSAFPAGTGGGAGTESPSGSPRRSFSSFDARTSDLPAAGNSLAARYDFSAALKGTKDRRSSNSPNMKNTDLPDVRTGLLVFGQGHTQGAQQAESSPDGKRSFPGDRFSSTNPGVNGTGTGSKNGHAAYDGDFLRTGPTSPSRPIGDFFAPAPTSAPSGSTGTDGAAPAPGPIVLPDVRIQGPSPEPTISPPATVFAPALEKSNTSSSSTTARRPSLSRYATSPAVLAHPLPEAVDDSPAAEAVSPPLLENSTSSTLTDTPSDSPRSPPDAEPSVTGAGDGVVGVWSPTGKQVENGRMSLGEYKGFIEQFCWGGASSPSFQGPSSLGAGTSGGLSADISPMQDRRSQSTSALDSYFSSPSTSGFEYRGHQGHRSTHSQDTTPTPGTGGHRPSSGGYFSPSTMGGMFFSPPMSTSTSTSGSGSYFSASTSTPTPANQEVVGMGMRGGSPSASVVC